MKKGFSRSQFLDSGGGHGDDLMITPLLDLFVALIPFLIMSVVLTKINVVDVGIAKPVASATQTKDAFDLNVKLGEKLVDVKLNGKVVSSLAVSDQKWIEQIHAKLVEIKRQHPEELKIRLEAHGSVPLEKMMALMDSARKLNSSDAAISRKDEQGRQVKLQYLFPHVILRGVYGS